MAGTNLVHFHYSIDLGDKPETGKETNCSSQQEEKEHNDKCVTKIEEGTSCSMYFQLGDKIVNTVAKQIDCCKTTGQEGTPPPMVIFGT